MEDRDKTDLFGEIERFTEDFALQNLGWDTANLFPEVNAGFHDSPPYDAADSQESGLEAQFDGNNDFIQRNGTASTRTSGLPESRFYPPTSSTGEFSTPADGQKTLISPAIGTKPPAPPALLTQNTGPRNSKNAANLDRQGPAHHGGHGLLPKGQNIREFTTTVRTFRRAAEKEKVIDFSRMAIPTACLPTLTFKSAFVKRPTVKCKNFTNKLSELAADGANFQALVHNFSEDFFQRNFNFVAHADHTEAVWTESAKERECIATFNWHVSEVQKEAVCYLILAEMNPQLHNLLIQTSEFRKLYTEIASVVSQIDVQKECESNRILLQIDLQKNDPQLLRLMHKQSQSLAIRLSVSASLVEAPADSLLSTEAPKLTVLQVMEKKLGKERQFRMHEEEGKAKTASFLWDKRQMMACNNSKNFSVFIPSDSLKSIVINASGFLQSNPSTSPIPVNYSSSKNDGEGPAVPHPPAGARSSKRKRPALYDPDFGLSIDMETEGMVVPHDKASRMQEEMSQGHFSDHCGYLDELENCNIEADNVSAFSQSIEECNNRTNDEMLFRSKRDPAHKGASQLAANMISGPFVPPNIITPLQEFLEKWDKIIPTDPNNIKNDLKKLKKMGLKEISVINMADESKNLWTNPTLHTLVNYLIKLATSQAFKDRFASQIFFFNASNGGNEYNCKVFYLLPGYKETQTAQSGFQKSMKKAEFITKAAMLRYMFPDSGSYSEIAKRMIQTLENDQIKDFLSKKTFGVLRAEDFQKSAEFSVLRQAVEITTSFVDRSRMAAESFQRNNNVRPSRY
jgi:hypothetical protein